MLTKKNNLFFILLLALLAIVNSNCFALVEWKCGDYKLLGQVNNNDFVVYPRSLSEYVFKDLLKAVLANQALHKQGIPNQGKIVVRVQVQELNQQGHPLYFSLSSFSSPSLEELRSLSSVYAVSLLAEKPCQTTPNHSHLQNDEPFSY